MLFIIISQLTCYSYTRLNCPGRGFHGTPNRWFQLVLVTHLFHVSVVAVAFLFLLNTTSKIWRSLTHFNAAITNFIIFTFSHSRSSGCAKPESEPKPRIGESSPEKWEVAGALWEILERFSHARICVHPDAADHTDTLWLNVVICNLPGLS